MTRRGALWRLQPRDLPLPGETGRRGAGSSPRCSTACGRCSGDHWSGWATESAIPALRGHMAERVAPRHAYPDRQSGGLDEAARDTRGTSVTFRIVERADEDLLADLFTEIDTTFFRPHPLTRAEDHRTAVSRRGDLHAI